MTTWFARSGRVLHCAAALAFMCPSFAVAQRQNGLLVGRVLSGDVAVPGAAITVSGGRVTIARVDGRYRLSVPAGRYEVRAQRIGYTTMRDSVTVLSGQTVTANFRLDRALSMLDAVATLGTKVYERSTIDVPAPVDVIQGAELRAGGRMETSRMLQALAPSVNAPRASFAEGSDLVHPVTLRGLGPDQVLVLVNGHRRHTSALLNVNGSTGRGSTGVDLDAIPASMIERIEVLRDGAAAQYGAEGVAGVINVVLKSGVHGDAATTVAGNVTTFNRAPSDVLVPSLPGSSYPVGERSTRDGRSVQASIDKGVVFGERGFLHGAFEYRDREPTNRALPDPRLQYPVGDPRAAQTGVSQDLVTNRLGDPARRDVALFLNGGNLLANGIELYGNAGASRRTMEAAGIFRRAIDPVTNTAAYPNGFLPVIRPTIGDYAGTAGARGEVADDWHWDLGTTYGRNTVEYKVADSQLSTGTVGGSFDAGTVRYGESVTTLELTRNLNIELLDELRVALGGEYRRESYGIGAATGGADIVGFYGFRDSEAVSRSRHDVAGYLDLEGDLGPDLLVGLAGRVERYSDVGTLGSGKLSLRYNPVPHVALRGSVGRSFRAPSLAQSYYGNFQTDPGTSGIVTSVARVDSPLLTGVAALRPERVTNASAGIAFDINALAVAADLYKVDVDDRVTLLENLTDGTPTSPYYSANAARTRTEGADVSASYGVHLGRSLLRLTAGGNVSRTEAIQTGSYGSLGVGRIGLMRLERGQPNVNLVGSALLTNGPLGALLRARHYGDTRTGGSQGGLSLDQYNESRTLVDANVSWTTLRKYTFVVGADNLFDVYPSRNSVPGSPATGAGNGYYGIFPYNNVSAFGFNGRLVYGRLSIYL